ncbi:hypothetical protein IMSHALPRED_006225 [Imshaugia aleurites]|uniref:Uncharacterized protein n=1 Tax=Imshaugia aleurites TaxID=172621 RepID=A0A8H3IMK1_9LECA|nr:hypothetical protein IMSHALPRED_006225 [Imshaugia aleurites]
MSERLTSASPETNPIPEEQNMLTSEAGQLPSPTRDQKSSGFSLDYKPPKSTPSHVGAPPAGFSLGSALAYLNKKYDPLSKSEPESD